MTDAASKRALVMTVMPRLVKLRSRSLLTSASSSGTICGRYSSSVTLTPTSWNMLANSTPTAPAPTITMSLGSVSILSTSSLVTIRLPSGSRPGSDLTREPVAMMTSVAFRTRSPPRARRAVLARLADPDLARTVELPAAGDPGHLVLVDEAS